MEKTWRWFGPNDKITLDMLRQIGVEGIVTSLHHIPNGEVWSYDEVMKMKSFIEEHGLRWSVVESLPVSEAIKYGGEDRDRLIENYKESLANLGKAGRVPTLNTPTATAPPTSTLTRPSLLTSTATYCVVRVPKKIMTKRLWRVLTNCADA